MYNCVPCITATPYFWPNPVHKVLFHTYKQSQTIASSLPCLVIFSAYFLSLRYLPKAHTLLQHPFEYSGNRLYGRRLSCWFCRHISGSVIYAVKFKSCKEGNVLESHPPYRPFRHINGRHIKGFHCIFKRLSFIQNKGKLSLTLKLSWKKMKGLFWASAEGLVPCITAPPYFCSNFVHRGYAIIHGTLGYYQKLIKVKC